MPAEPSAPITTPAVTAEPSARVTVAESASWSMARTCEFCRTVAPAETAALYQAWSKSSRRTMVRTGSSAERRVKPRLPRSVKVIAETWSRTGTLIRAAAMPSEMPSRPPPQVL